MKNYYSIDIGGTYTKIAYLDEDGQILQLEKIKTASPSADAFYDKVTAFLTHKAYGIGICAPGIFRNDGMILSASSGNASLLYQTNPILELQKRTGLAASLLNDAKACGLCEFYRGAAKGKKRAAVYVIGTGIGGCLIDENGIHTGANGFSGEFSYMPIYHQGAIAQLGNEASMTGLLRYYQSLGHPEVDDTHIITRRYFQKEADAQKAIDHWLEAITMQLITIHSVYDPQIICIGGAISAQAWVIEALRERYRQMARSFISPTLPDQTIITACAYQGEANLIGAFLHMRKESEETA
ncbi:ROK family protein [Massilicoli timonensis]|uniref:ROK family protein n=1 Tax=Massilicoli timonensis TaxID=2015901 RepID=UPI00307AEE70